jgi:acyl-CoA thioesterase FadM
LQTWVSDLKQIQSHREYHLTLADTGETVLRAQTNWVFIQAASLKPARTPPEMIAAFTPNGQSVFETPPPRLRRGQHNPGRSYITQRRVQHYEIDPAQHVNNAVYLDWATQAMADIGGHTPTQQPSTRLCRCRLDYLKPALYGDTIRLTSYMIDQATTETTWRHELRRQTDEALLVQVDLTYEP